METAVAELARSGKALARVAVDKPLEVSRGTGHGKILDLEAGRRRLADYATPTRLEDWAGPVAGPGDIEKMFGTKPSTLHDWRKRGAVIGLLRGERKHVFPLTQFVDGRPVEGMGRITAIIGTPRTPWLWLTRQRVSETGETPLDRLKRDASRKSSRPPSSISADRGLAPETVAELAIRFEPHQYLRAMRRAHAATQPGMGVGQSRFASPDRSFMVLCIARDLPTAIAETIVRDRFEGTARSMPPRSARGPSRRFLPRRP